MACQSLWPSVPSFSVAPTVRILSRVVGATLAAFYCPRQKRELFHGWRLLFPHRLVPGSADGWSRKKPKSSTRSSAVGILVQLTILMVDTMKSPWETFGTNSFHILTMIQKGLKTCLAYFIVVNNPLISSLCTVQMSSKFIFFFRNQVRSLLCLVSLSLLVVRFDLLDLSKLLHGFL